VGDKSGQENFYSNYIFLPKLGRKDPKVRKFLGRGLVEDLEKKDSYLYYLNDHRKKIY